MSRFAPPSNAVDPVAGGMRGRVDALSARNDALAKDALAKANGSRAAPSKSTARNDADSPALARQEEKPLENTIAWASRFRPSEAMARQLLEGHSNENLQLEPISLESPSNSQDVPSYLADEADPQSPDTERTDSPVRAPTEVSSARRVCLQALDDAGAEGGDGNDIHARYEELLRRHVSLCQKHENVQAEARDAKLERESFLDKVTRLEAAKVKVERLLKSAQTEASGLWASNADLQRELDRSRAEAVEANERAASAELAMEAMLLQQSEEQELEEEEDACSGPRISSRGGEMHLQGKVDALRSSVTEKAVLLNNLLINLGRCDQAHLKVTESLLKTSSRLHPA